MRCRILGLRCAKAGAAILNRPMAPGNLLRTAVPCKSRRRWIVVDGLWRRGSAWRSGKILLIISIIPIILIITIILIILIIPNCRTDKRRQQTTTLSFHRLPGVCWPVQNRKWQCSPGPLQAIAPAWSGWFPKRILMNDHWTCFDYEHNRNN